MHRMVKGGVCLERKGTTLESTYPLSQECESQSDDSEGGM